ncbi:hypothetical protein [Dongia sedimenti]|uniref:XRE family transcriptional regulator n=1 Tax=Dongia sedimenti TaxID=3064282 RepID=A0ABU0YTZ4_9PROT|nr:hypothetical protein [Rhodospirillaceae bacterium R-7]
MAATEEREINAVAEYKRVLARVLENRPSGTRQRLAVALGKNRSFVSQIANPSYSTPIPVPHLEIIFEICLFPANERKAFLEAYGRAHPGKLERTRHRKDHRLRPVTVYVPDLEDDAKNHALDRLLADIATRIGKLTED